MTHIKFINCYTNLNKYPSPIPPNTERWRWAVEENSVMLRKEIDDMNGRLSSIGYNGVGDQCDESTKFMTTAMIVSVIYPEFMHEIADRALLTSLAFLHLMTFTLLMMRKKMADKNGHLHEFADRALLSSLAFLCLMTFMLLLLTTTSE